MEDRKIFVCDCNSLEHQYTFWYNDDDNELYFEPHLYYGTWPWYKRFWNRLKYLFGYKSRFGAWDEVIINPDDATEIIKYLNKIAHTEIEVVADRGRD